MIYGKIEFRLFEENVAGQFVAYSLYDWKRKTMMGMLVIKSGLRGPGRGHP